MEWTDKASGSILQFKKISEARKIIFNNLKKTECVMLVITVRLFFSRWELIFTSYLIQHDW